MPLMRLDKLLSQTEGCSRAQAKTLLGSGAVTIDGAPAKNGSQKFDPDLQQIRVNGRRIYYSDHSYIIMNKPLGVVSSTSGSDGKTVLDILPPELSRKGLFPAGRLDKHTRGLLIITSDGDFGHRLTSPAKRLPKIYEFELDSPILCPSLAEKFAAGVYLGGGEYSSPAELEIFSPSRGRVTIYEGIYHQVRRMFDQNGGKVIDLRRVQIGGLPLPPDLSEGQSRLLSEQELALLLPQPPSGQTLRRTPSPPH